jgi:predicted phage tail protein
MKNLINKNIIRFALVIFIIVISISCVDSLNSPYPGTSINSKSGDSISEAIATPTNLNIVEFTEGKVFGLWWEDNSNNEDGFEVWRKDGSNDYVKVRVLPTNSTAYNDTITNKNVVYTYKVRAFKSSTFSKFSNEVNTAENLGLAAPSELSGEVVPNTTNVKLNWNDNSSNELGFIIERKVINEYEYNEAARVGPNSITWTDTSDKLQAGLTIFYRVKAYNTTDFSNYSNLFSITL